MQTLTTDTQLAGGGSRPRREVLGLVVVWCRDEPGRLGEVLLPDPLEQPRGGWMFGRGGQAGARLALERQRPGSNELRPPLALPQLSQDQLRIRVGEGGLELDNVGRRTLLIDGVEQASARVGEGELVELRGQIMFVVARRPLELPELELPASLLPRFGEPDEFGMLGESPPAWTLRGQIAFAAARDVHVLVQGQSGVGKEQVARAIHELSSRAAHPLVARNAATLPETLIDAELFGNLRDYPNPGMPERPGLIGAAHRGSLLLDEIGELPHELQAHLLRVLDAGEYQRLGESTTRRADFRLLAATNRPLGELKHDLAARLRLRVAVPSLAERREDIGLLIPYLIRRMAGEDPLLARRFFAGDPRGAPRVDAGLVRVLVRQVFPTNVRELEGALWTAMMHSVVAGHAQVEAAGLEEAGMIATPVEVDLRKLTREQLEQALAQAEGVQDRAWRLLGLRNRFALSRLMKKHGLA
ncbi:sigma 54-interacting transcriptional regulator [Nannocystaceae bacterium ST9]